MPGPQASTSDEFVARLKAGDEQAWTELYQQHAGRIAGYARSKGVRDVDDLVGDVFAAAAERLDRFDGDATRLRSWLFTIAHHRLADDLRRTRRRGIDATAPVDLEDIAQEADAYDDSASRLDAHGALTMLSWVTDDQREVLSLRILGELTIAETAAILEKPPGAIKALQHRAIARIQRRLGDEPYPIGPADDGRGEP